jgi:16S rRNA (guanine966-N2)-methyltransferase
MLRIAAGKYKNKILEVEKFISRPFTERMRVSVMDLLTEHLPGADVLDLYAGSGAVALEALSRGAKSITLVESDRKACDVIKSNLHSLDIKKEADALCMSVQDFIKTSRKVFDIIFLDPPFDKVRNFDSNLNINDLVNISHKNTIIVLRVETEIHKKEKISAEKLEKVYDKKFGRSMVIFYYPKI